METIFADQKIIDLGYEGENKSKKIIFNIPCDWLHDANKIKLCFQHSEKTQATQYDVSIVNDLIEWQVPDSATTAGWGTIQLIYTDSDNIYKTKIYDTVCKKSLTVSS